MRTSDLVASLSALTLSVIGVAHAFDGTAPNAVAPAVSMGIVARGAVTAPPATVTTPALAAPGPTLAVPAPALAASPSKPFDLTRKPSAAEAFRAGTRALNAGDVKTGLAALEYAAGTGHVVARWKLARIYADGQGVAHNDHRAFQLFSEIAEDHADDNPRAPQARFIANSFVALGLYYLDGIPNTPIAANSDKAREMFEYAAAYFGDADAQYNLARLLLDGKVSAKDARVAARWLSLAANKGQHQAQALLGALLFKGELLPREAARGLMWLTLASDSARAKEAWIRQLHDDAFKQATDDERQTALIYIEQRLNGRR
jgi:TPR repeat protein